ncbi:MAG TPA: NAD-dependent deacylase [Acidobacteriota bacterium]|nr:NAD-dependent deacylase [Acidobacteriota bacterium]
MIKNDDDLVPDLGWHDYPKWSRASQANSPWMNEQLFSHSFLSVLKRCTKITVSTGAGFSAESGDPTFRGADGLWKNYRPEQLATPEAFQENPVRVWEWYDWRRQLYAKLQPHAGHLALVELESMYPHFHIFTQNVDGLHQKAGSKNVHELHGNIWRARCTRDDSVVSLAENPLKEIPPRCECGAILRPDVVWFGESLPQDVQDAAFAGARMADAFFMVGSSATVQPAASLAWVAAEHGALVVEINPESTPLTEIAHESFRGPAGAILPMLVRELKTHHD